MPFAVGISHGVMGTGPDIGAHDIICTCGHAAYRHVVGSGNCNGNGCRFVMTNRTYCSEHGVAGCKPVIDDDSGFIFHGRERLITPEYMSTFFDDILGLSDL